MKRFEYLILGGGTTAGYAAQELIEQGIKGSKIGIISAENMPPMDRPPISKDYLRGETERRSMLVNEKEFYKRHDIELHMKSIARSVDFDNKRVTMLNKREFTYDNLLIATGGSVNTLNKPGNELPGIFYLRKADDADEIRKAAKAAHNVVIMGGGFIGTEVAASLRQLDVNVALVFPEERMLQQLIPAEASRYLESYYKERGVKLYPKNDLVNTNGEEVLEGVSLATGEHLKADMLIVAIGIRPNTALFNDTPLEIEEGIVTDEFCQTNISNVFAAGDVAQFPDMVFGKSRMHQHWENAVEQGKIAARSMIGLREEYDRLPAFFSDIFDLSYDFIGDNTDADSHFIRGKMDEGEFGVWYFSRDKLVAAFIMSTRPEKEREQARYWIRHETLLDAEKIENENIDLQKVEKEIYV
ncbi:MAG: FAD-dependent oxidoreductase [Bacteroidales bacterium]|nr:FAD-dependent oxidoreductase [Bacteroidales bacterium]